MTASVDLGQDIRTLAPGLIALRRAIHEHPELAFEEVWTAATLAARLRALGLAVEEGIGGTGVLAVLEGRTPGRTLLVRADMDALAMEETTGRAYASDNARRARLLGRVAEVAGALVGAAGGTLRAEVDYAIPAVVNDAHVTRAVERAAQRVIGQANIITGWRNRFADDVGLFLAEAPGCLILLGTANPDRGITELWHRPGFDVDEDALPLGVHIMSLAALDLLR
jgi:metal-dependent amidase/aminoacylase/carboxypeptidase family protein